MLPRVVLRLEQGLFSLDRDEGRACSRPSPKPARFTAICDLAEEAAAPAPGGVTERIAVLLRGHSKPRRIAITRRQNTRTLSACSVLAASSSIELRLAVEQDGQIMIIASGIGIWSPLPLRWDRRTQI